MNALAVYTIVLMGMLVINYYYIEIEQRSPNHLFWALLRMFIFGIAAMRLYPAWEDRIVLFLGFEAAFWLPFDTILNLLRKREWDYIGQTAWTDRLGSKWPAAFFWTRVLFLIYGIATLSYDLSQLHIYEN